MAKQSLPSVDASSMARQAAQPAQSKSEEMPIITDGYAGRAIDVKMNHDQAVKFKSILRALEDRAETLSDGTPVSNRRRAALWLIENAGSIPGLKTV